MENCIKHTFLSSVFEWRPSFFSFHLFPFLSSPRYGSPLQSFAAFRYQSAFKLNCIELVRILPCWPTPASSNQFFFLITVQCVAMTTSRTNSVHVVHCWTFYRLLTATVFVRICFLTIQICVSYVLEMKRCQFRSVSQNVSVIPMRSKRLQLNAAETEVLYNQPPVVDSNSCRGHHYVSISLRPTTWAFLWAYNCLLGLSFEIFWASHHIQMLYSWND